MLVRRGVGRVGRPGLLGSVARTAVVAGTATAVAGGVSRRQQQRTVQAQQAQAYQDEQAQQQPPGDDGMAELQQLAEMHTQGLLTDDEFAAAKSKLLGL
jgi:membrane protease subunit (stomatin/prohibitin family)